MSLTAHRVIQYIVIIILCALAGGGYWYWKDQHAKASVTEKSSDTTGLIGYWSFDEGSGTKAEDFSPTGSNTGTLTNSPTWVDGKVGKALSFDGADDWVDSGSSTSLNTYTDYTISMWVYNGAGSDTYPTLFNRAAQATNNGFFWVYTGGTNEADLSFQWADGTNFQSTAFNGALGLNTWQHVVFTFDNASKALKLYINGSQFSTTRTLTGALPVDDGTLYIGTYTGTATNYSFQGSLDEVRVYSRVLSGANVLDLYQKSVGSKVNTTENNDLTSGLVGLWSFNGADVSGTTSYDRSGSGRNVTLTGPTTTVGKIGQALSFDGNDDYAELSNVAGATKNASLVSYVAWVKPASFAKDYGAFYIESVSGTTLWRLGCGFRSSGKPVCGGRASDAQSLQEWRGNTAVSVGEWHHFAGVVNVATDTVEIYIDGVLMTNEATGNFSNSVFDNTNSLHLIMGSTASGSSEDFTGIIDEVRVYNRTLSATEVWNLYQAGGGAQVNSANSQIDALERGLSGYWKLDDASGTTATDSATNGNNGTLTNGPTWTTGQIGGATTFDGSNDYITIPNSNDFAYNQDFSVSVWAKIPTTQNDLAAADNSLFEKWSNSGGYPYVLRVFNSTYVTSADRGKVNFARYDGTNNPSIKSISALNDNLWHLITATKNGSTLALYVDGVRQSTTTDTTTGTTTNASPLCLGMRCSTANYFTGSLDEMRIYSRGLSPEEVVKLYKSTAPDNPDTGLKGYWSFNGLDVSGTTAYDRSGVGNNGTLTNGPTVTPGKVGQALSFDGVNDYVSMGDVNAIDSASTLTLSVWLKRRAVNSILTVGKSEAQTRTFNINAYNDGKIYVNVGDGGLNTYGSFTSNDTDWHHVVFVFDGNLSGNANRAKAYLDGVAQSLTFSQTIPAATQASADIFTVGRDTALSTFSTGNIDEVRVYSRAFTQTEVTNLYNLGR